jgi:ATP-dependent helicase Lhr and Lhr-like helicase
MSDVFNILNSRIRDLAISRFKKPTYVQEQAIPKVLEGKNVLILAETGGGKTESVMLSLFSKLMDKEHYPIAMLYITPMRALNRDLMDRLLWWCNELDLEISVRHGDTTQYERKLQVENPPHIMITTPEQINAMMAGKKLREYLRNVKYIVVDEVHEIVNSKRGVQLTLSLERLKKYCGNPQIVGLSATVGSPELTAKFLFSDNKHEIVRAISPKDMQLKVESPMPTAEDKLLAEQIFIGDSVVSRLRMIHDTIMEHKSALVFTNTREAAEILSSRLRLLDKDFPHEIHHSSLSKEVRVKAEKDFKIEKLKALIATSSLELGIDIGSIDIVIQYMSPRQVSKITQKVGRSGHGVGRISKGIIIASEGDDLFESSVIARKTLKGELEEVITHELALDVLTHQIMGLLVENYNMKPKDIYETFIKAYPYRNLTYEDFTNLINFLANQMRMIFVDKEEVKRRKKAFEYYFENLSVIPDQKSFKVIDTASNSFVGNLDEEFIASHADVGSTFIVKGRPWKILSIENDKIYVMGVDDITSAVPAWEGELIPVQFDVAQEVGKLRKDIKDMLADNLGDTEIADKLKEKYPISTQVAVKMTRLIKKQMEKSQQFPDNKNIVMETFKEYVVLHCMFGNKVNETLSRLISTILSAEHGEMITTKCDPYRIILKNCTAEEVKKILLSYKPEEVEVVLEKSLPRSSLFKSRFIRTCKRFGAITRSAIFSNINIDRLIDAYWNTPIYKETLREIFTDKFDLKRTAEIVDKIRDKSIKLIETEGLSPLAELGFSYELQDVVKPERPEKEIFNIFKNRLLMSKIRLLCINCGKYSIIETVEDVEKEPRCKKCQSKLIAALRVYQTEAQKTVGKWLRGEDMTKEEEAELDRVKKSADMVIDYGRKAVIAMAGRGVGPETAKRLLAKMYKEDDDFYKEILKAEREWIKNKRFWT